MANVVLHHDREVTSASGRVKGISQKETLNSLQGFGEGFSQTGCSRRQFHARTRSHKQRIVQEVSESFQCMAGCRLGETPAVKRRVFTVSSGEFVGDRLRGEVLPQAGSDLLLVRADGSSQQDVRLILRTDDGALIIMTYRGVRHASPEVNDRVARGEQVMASDYYLRTAPFFETSSAKYAWLNKIVSIGIGERQPDGV